MERRPFRGWQTTRCRTMVEAYCMKCKAKQQMTGATPSKMANGRDCVKGTCSACGTPMFKIGKM